MKKGLVVMATGLGKTILSALDVSNFEPSRMLFIAHREEILRKTKKSRAKRRVNNAKHL